MSHDLELLYSRCNGITYTESVGLLLNPGFSEFRAPPCPMSRGLRLTEWLNLWHKQSFTRMNRTTQPISACRSVKPALPRIPKPQMSDPNLCFENLLQSRFTQLPGSLANAPPPHFSLSLSLFFYPSLLIRTGVFLKEPRAWKFMIIKIGQISKKRCLFFVLLPLFCSRKFCVGEIKYVSV